MCTLLRGVMVEYCDGDVIQGSGITGHCVAPSRAFLSHNKPIHNPQCPALHTSTIHKGSNVLILTFFPRPFLSLEYFHFFPGP